MARRRKIGELLESEVECFYCNSVIPARSMRCPSCGKLFSSAKKIIAFAVVLVVVAAALSFLVASQFLSGHEGYNDGLEPNGGNGTTAGKIIKFELYESEAPITCENFKKYANDGFFSGTIFHRVIDGFMIQGGGFTPDMTQKPTTYPPISLEISPNLRHEDGSVAMARTNDPNSATSQFYICDGPQPSLDDNYAVFGKVVQGMSVVRDISTVTTDTLPNGQADVPVSTVLIQSIIISTEGGKTFATISVDF
jgi:cyclophilin family peptidyl-prolyl cis-trans isomerase